MAILALLYSLFTQHLSLFFGSVPLPSILSTLFLQETRCECQCKSGRAKRQRTCRCFFVQSILNKAYRCSKCKKVYETSLHITNGSKNVKNTKMAQKGFHGNLECNSHIFAVDLRDHFYFIPPKIGNREKMHLYNLIKKFYYRFHLLSVVDQKNFQQEKWH